jgi:hypothetical protein
MLRAGETRVSHLAMIAARITEANADLLLDGIRGQTRRAVEVLAKRVTDDGRLLTEEVSVDLRLTLTESQLAVLNRAREVLSAGGKVPSLPELVVKALDDLLERRDPCRRAERAEARAKAKASSGVAAAGQGHETVDQAPAADLSPEEGGDIVAARQRGQTPSRGRPAIPAAVRHAVWRRDGGRCTFLRTDGSRCEERAMLELDHFPIPWCRGGTHAASNLVLRCRAHNRLEAERVLGRKFMSRWTGFTMSNASVDSF